MATVLRIFFNNDLHLLKVLVVRSDLGDFGVHRGRHVHVLHTFNTKSCQKKTCRWIGKKIFSVPSEFVCIRLPLLYSWDLKSGLVWILNGQNEVGSQMI